MWRPTVVPVLVVAALSSAVLVSCGSAACRAAERGDYAKMRAEIRSEHESGHVSTGEAACLARAVASREIMTAKDDAAGASRVDEARACSSDLADALEARMGTHDRTGAAAALALLEDRHLSEGRARDWLGDPDDRWRAVGTRTLHREDDRKARQSAVLDPSPHVRRSAIRAAAEARDVADLDLLFETARVDPELLLRNEAVRAMNAILRSDEGKSRASEHVVRLRDLWASGDEALREDVAVAWALSPAFESGGREALRVQIASGKGPGAIAAAGAALRNARNDAELVASASAHLVRTIHEGPRRDRLHAIVLARTSGAELEALRKASKEEDDDVRVPALARLLESAKDRDAARKELREIARAAAVQGPNDRDERAAQAAAQARLALAQAGATEVQRWVEKELGAPEPSRRLGAASALAALGRPSRAVMLLADPDASVRTRAACTMLVAARR